MPASEQPLIIALTHVLEDAAQFLDVPVEELVVIRVEAARWPDSCLGLGAPGEACADVVTKGYRVRLKGGATYRTDLIGTVRRERRSIPRPGGSPMGDEIRIHYTVSGGITGRRDEYEIDTTRLTKAEVRELRGLVADADVFTIPAGQASQVPDGTTRRLWVAVGRRSREIVRGDGVDIRDSAALDALIGWVEERMVA